MPSPALEPVVWGLREAATRDDARSAATVLARVAAEVPPGEVVSAVRSLVEEGCRWRADAFAVLLFVLGTHGEAALDGFDGLVRSLIVDPDPETRSLACLLLGWISAEPAVDLELLRMVRSVEADERARACAAEAGLRIAGPAEALALLDDPSPVVRRRVARFLVPARHNPDPEGLDPAVVARARQVLAEPAAAGEPSSWWQAEMI